MKKIIVIFIFGILILTSFMVVSEITQLTSITMAPPGDFYYMFPNPMDVNYLVGKDIIGDDLAELMGHVHRITDTKDPPNNIVDVCDNVVIEWKKDKNPQLRSPWVTYHVDKVGENIDGWSVYWFDKKSDSKNAPFSIPNQGNGSRIIDENSSYYVDVGNTVGPWDGTMDHPFRYIQDGVDVAEPGNNIIVFPGFYEENLLIDKNDIAVVPADFDQIIIDGGYSGSTITIKGDWVVLHGLTIQNSGNLEEDAGVDICSDNSTIFGNNVQLNQNGIYLHHSADNNQIYENNIQSNVWGVFIWDESNNNSIYTNNLISNTGFNAKDKSQNIWYSNIYNGNYWDDYSGLDDNGDGIGDIPYMILGSGNEDLYPLIDSYQNSLPGTPDIDGPNSGIINENYSYSFMSLDPDCHDLLFDIDWGDGFNEQSSFYISSGTMLSFNHSWDKEGSYTIQVRAMDCYGSKSDWSTLSISIPKSKTHNNILQMILHKFLSSVPFRF